MAALAGVAAALTNVLGPLENATVDARFRLRPADPPAGVVVVAIDDLTFSELGRQWPFPRSVHARAVDRLRAAGARQIVYDVQFTEPTTRREDLALYRAVARAPGTILATSETDGRGGTNVLGGDAGLGEAHARAAASNLPTEAGGVIHRFRATWGGLPTIGVRSADLLGSPPDRSVFGRDGAWIDFRGPPGTVPTVSFAALVRGRVDPRLLRGKVAVVGASAPTLQDVHPTPGAAHELMSGPEVQANVIWTALHGLPLRSVPRWADLLLIALCGLAPALAGLRLRTLHVAVLTPVAGLVLLAAAMLAFVLGAVVLVAYPLAALAVGGVGTIVAGYVAVHRERQRVVVENEVLEARVRERTAELRDTHLELVRRLGRAVEFRDGDTGLHIDRMSWLCHRLGLAAGMGRDEAELLRHASALHDVGKIGVPDRVLQKPGRLEADEWEVMKRHAAIGAELLAGSPSPLVQLAETIAGTHHERWDGTGYPAGLRGEEIPLCGRIAAICDVFDALQSERPYKRAWTVEEAAAELRSERGRHFDPALVDVFLAELPALRRELGELPAPVAAGEVPEPVRESSLAVS